MTNFSRKFALAAAAALVALAACSGDDDDDRTSRRDRDRGRASEARNDTGPEAGPGGRADAMFAPSGPARPLPEGAYLLKLTPIMDPQSGNMTAARILLPEGWTTEGGVQWATAPCTDPARFAWQGRSPDGLNIVAVPPTMKWTTNPNDGQGCQQANITSVQQYLDTVLNQMFPGAQVTGYRDRPDFLELNRPVIEMRKQMNAQLAQNGLMMNLDVQAGEIAFVTQINGQPVEGVFSATVELTSGGIAAYGQAPGVNIGTYGGSTSSFVAVAPQGKLDLRFAEAIRKSAKLDPRWGAEYMKLLDAIGQQQTDQVRQNAAIAVANGAAMTRATIERNNAAVAAGAERLRNNHNSIYADAGGTTGGDGGYIGSDDAQRKRIDLINGVESYHDPIYEGTVKLDNTYDHAWRVTNSDSYILTNDPNFNPGQYNIQAQELQRLR